MTFDSLETSIESSQALELYIFTFGAESFRFTSYNADVIWQGIPYTSTQISRSEAQSSIEDAVNQITITTLLTNPVAQKFINNVPGIVGSVQILRANANDVSQETIELFEGYVASVKFDGQLEAQILCNPQTNNFNRTGPRVSFQSLCNYILYDANCKVNRGAFTYTGLVSGVSGADITINGVSGLGASWAVGGFIQAPSGAPVDKRMVLSQSGDTLTMLLPFSIATLGTQVDVLAGCNHSLTGDCLNKFSNTINYGGFFYVPSKNPFSSTLRGGK